MPSRRYYEALATKAARRFRDATNDAYQGRRIIQDGLIVNRFVVGVRGTRYDMDSSALAVQSGDACLENARGMESSLNFDKTTGQCDSHTIP